MNVLRASLVAVAAACAASTAACGPIDDTPPARAATPTESTCGDVYPSYWQDPDPRFSAMWAGQQVSNAPPAGWTGPVFRLSDGYPAATVDDAASQPWRDARFAPMFDPATDQATKTALAEEYAWAVMAYIQEGNVGSGDVATD